MEEKKICRQRYNNQNSLKLHYFLFELNVTYALSRLQIPTQRLECKTHSCVVCQESVRIWRCEHNRSTSFPQTAPQASLLVENSISQRICFICTTSTYETKKRSLLALTSQSNIQGSDLLSHTLSNSMTRDFVMGMWIFSLYYLIWLSFSLLQRHPILQSSRPTVLKMTWSTQAQARKE